MAGIDPTALNAKLAEVHQALLDAETARDMLLAVKQARVKLQELQDHISLVGHYGA